MGKSDHRGTRRTKTRIQNAMLELIREKPYQTISVREILDRADVCRATFYAHYHDVYDLVDEIENELIGQLLEENRKLFGEGHIETEHPIITEMYRLALRYENEFKVLSGSHGDPAFISKVQDALIDISTQILREKYGPDADETMLALTANCTISSCLSFLLYVLRSEAALTIEQIGYQAGEMVVAIEHVFLKKT